jgi:hypothetical protein
MGTIKQNRANNIVTGGKIDATDGLNNNVPAANIANASLTNVTAYPPSTGAGVSQLASDPPSPTEGQMWYNTTTNTLKQYALGAGAWASGGSLNTARSDFASAGANNTAAVAFGGFNDPTGTIGNTESYNGSSWTEVNDLTTARFAHAGSGVSTSALAFGGYSTDFTNITESWNGTSWTEVNDLNTTRLELGNAGVSNTSALGFGGRTPPSTYNVTVTESWNGTSWTEVNDLNTGRETRGAGTLTSAIAIAGKTGTTSGQSSSAETWNGTSWTTVASLNTARYATGAAGVDNTSALAFGGEPGPGTPQSAATEEWNGTSWTETTDLSTARSGVASGNGTLESALASGGITTTRVATTEEWTKAVAIQTITAS